VRAKLASIPHTSCFQDFFFFLQCRSMSSVANSLNSTNRRTVTDCDRRVPGRPDPIARARQVHLQVASQIGADHASPPPTTTTGARGRKFLPGGEDAHREAAGFAVVVFDGARQRLGAQQRLFSERQGRHAGDNAT
jgi:hypothetical protein